MEWVFQKFKVHPKSTYPKYMNTRQSMMLRSFACVRRTRISYIINMNTKRIKFSLIQRWRWPSTLTAHIFASDFVYFWHSIKLMLLTSIHAHKHHTWPHLRSLNFHSIITISTSTYHIIPRFIIIFINMVQTENAFVAEIHSMRVPTKEKSKNFCHSIWYDFLTL